MSKWRNLICCGHDKHKSSYQEKHEVRVHHRGDTMVTLEEMLRQELANKKIITYVKPRPSTVSIAQSELSSGIGR